MTWLCSAACSATADWAVFPDVSALLCTFRRCSSVLPCLDATFLAYRGDFYQQTFGTAMGSPVSVTVANLVMEDVEQRALSSYPSPPPFWKRYVDDTLTALHRDQVQCFQFTIEMESAGTLPFIIISA